MTPFIFHPAQVSEVPIIVSVPHCGVDFPAELQADYVPELARQPDDTDWFVDRLYEFAPAMGMNMITARYSRWVIDLNRDPQNKALYSDGRIITSVCPATTFLGEKIYRDGRESVSGEESLRRRELYYTPYHKKIEDELIRLERKFGTVLLWDCHSIRQCVPTIQSGNFPDLILGDADGSAAADSFIQRALTILASGSFAVSHNHPFKGGYITRHFGHPPRRHALQLEMTKVNYMEDDERTYSPARAAVMQKLLREVFTDLIAALSTRAV